MLLPLLLSKFLQLFKARQSYQIERSALFLSGDECFQIFQNFFGRLVTQRTPLGHHAMHHATQNPRHGWISLMQRRCWIFQMLHGNLHGRGATKRRFAAQQLITGHSEGIHIGARIQFPPTDLLRAHVQWRSHRHAGGLVTAISQLCQSEVRNLYLALFRDEDILRFDITVHDAGFARGLQSGGDLTHDVQDGRQIQFAAFANQRCQVTALHKLLSDVVQAVFLPDGVDLDDVGVVETCRHHRFLLEARQHVLPRMGHQSGLHHLDRDVALQRRLLRKKHVRHAPAAKMSQQVEFSKSLVCQVTHDCG